MKKLFSMHLNVDAFLPATEEEKAYMVQMRPSTTFFRDGVKRFVKNKVALVSLIIVVLVVLSSILLPLFIPYSYDQMLGVQLGKPVDASYNNLAPFEYGETELQRMEAGEKIFPHIFGTDSQGRDYFIRVVYGARISLAVGFFATNYLVLKRKEMAKSHLFSFWQGQKGSNPRPTVLETGTLPTELYPYVTDTLYHKPFAFAIGNLKIF